MHSCLHESNILIINLFFFWNGENEGLEEMTCLSQHLALAAFLPEEMQDEAPISFYLLNVTFQQLLA